MSSNFLLTVILKLEGDYMKKILLLLSLVCGLATTAFADNSQENLRTFIINDNVTAQKVKFKNRYNIELVGELYTPKDLDRNQKHSALIIGHPFGAVKEQVSGFYANELARRGFVALTFDASYSGESGGEPRLTVSPEADVEDFSAAVDFIGTQNFIDRNKIGVIGICDSGGFVLSAATIDPRMKAIATVSMYDMGRVRRQGLNDTISLDQRKRNLEAITEQRWVEFAFEEDPKKTNMRPVIIAAKDDIQDKVIVLSVKVTSLPP